MKARVVVFVLLICMGFLYTEYRKLVSLPSDPAILRINLSHRHPAYNVCKGFVAEVNRIAKENPDKKEFIKELRVTFIAGQETPFAIAGAMKSGQWNQLYFYAGSGGFLSYLDDDRKVYEKGGNHQPGHFISVFTMATKYGNFFTRAALAGAGDYKTGEKDDLRLSKIALQQARLFKKNNVSSIEMARGLVYLCK